VEPARDREEVWCQRGHPSVRRPFSPTRPCRRRRRCCCRRRRHLDPADPLFFLLPAVGACSRSAAAPSPSCLPVTTSRRTCRRSVAARPTSCVLAPHLSGGWEPAHREVADPFLLLPPSPPPSLSFFPSFDSSHSLFAFVSLSSPRRSSATRTSSPTPKPRSPCASTTSATARTSSARTCARAGPT